MTLTELAISNDRVTAVLVSLLLVSGLLAYNALPKAQDPGFTIRTAVITTRFPGASPERVELLVTDKLEKKAQEMPEVDNITSESRTGISVINVNFKESYTQMRPIFDDLRRKIEDVSEDLPEGIRGPFVNDEFGDVFGSVYTLRGDGFTYAELQDVAEEIRDILLKEPDVAKVSIHGTQEEVVYVDYSNARLSELGLSPNQLAQALGAVNIVSSGGNVLTGRERIALEPTGNFESVADLARVVLQLPGGGVVYLEDIARVYRAYVDPPDNLARANGEATLAFAVSMRDGGDILKLGQRLDELIPEIQARYPWGIEIDKVWFQASLVQQNVSNFVNNLLQAILIVVLVVVAFLGFRTGLLVASLIPSTMVITFFLMDVFEITINQISLAALIIALGLLVDNAIVIVESILVKRSRGLGGVQAAIDTGMELKTPLLVSSLTTAAAFMPIALAESAVGEYTADIFYVVTIALLVSWGLAMTLVPMLSTRTLPASTQPSDQASDGDVDPFSSRWYGMYRSVLLAALRQKVLTVLIVIGVFWLSLQGLGLVPAEFIAPSEDPVFTGKLELPLGTSIETTQEVIEDLDRFIERRFGPESDDPVMTNWLVFVGDGGPRFTLGLDPPTPNAANAFLVGNTTEGKEVDRVIPEIQNFLFENHPDMAAQIARLENGPPVGFPIIVRLSAERIEDIYELAEQVTSKLYEDPRISSVQNSWGLQTKKLRVQVSQERARRAGVTSNDVAYSLRASLAGVDLTEYREGDTIIPVKLRTVAADRQDIGKLEGMAIYSAATGSAVPLRQVADISLTFEPGIIERRDRSRTLYLNVQLRGSATASEVNADLLPWLDEVQRDWPAGSKYEIGGESEESGEANASIAAKLPIAVMFIVLLLVGQFNSVRRPVIILSTIPLGLIGVTIGLLVARSTLGFFTILGVISLSGIIINNAIVLLDRINIEVEKYGRSQADAVVAASQHRLRPILLTTATTVLGMMPLWWGGTAMFEPMAVSIIFGLAFATLLTLIVVPVLYALFFRVNFSGDFQPAGG